MNQPCRENRKTTKSKCSLKQKTKLEFKLPSTIISLALLLHSSYGSCFPMDTSLLIRRRFDVEIPRGKFAEIRRGNYEIDPTWKFRDGFDFQNCQIIDEFPTRILLCPFDVQSM